MQIHIQTSSSNMIPISDFHYIYDLAKCSKCQLFVLLKNTNKLYGTYEYDSSAIHEIDVPFLVNTDLTFRFDNIDKNLLDSYKSFFVPEKFDWVILPDYYWDMYISGDLVSIYNYDINQSVVYDKTTKQPIQQIFMYRCRRQDDFERNNFMSQIEGYLNRQRTLGPPEIFKDAHMNPNIRKSLDSKASAGRLLCILHNSNIEIPIYFYKSIFSLAKADSLDIEVRFDTYQTNLFMITFIPKKKKNPITFNTYGVGFQEKIHCMCTSIL